MKEQRPDVRGSHPWNKDERRRRYVRGSYPWNNDQMFEDVTQGTKTKDEEDPTKGLEDKTNCYRRKNDNLLSYCSI